MFAQVIAARLIRASGCDLGKGSGDAADETNGHSFALALAQPLSIVLGNVAEQSHAPQSNFTAEESKNMKLPIWMYWEGACPDWIKACRETILAHAPDARLLAPETFNQLRDVDLDIDLNRLQVEHRSDFIRAFLLFRYGGLWIDSDCLLMQPLQPLLDKLREYDFLAHRERSGNISNAFIGAPPESQIAAELYRGVCYLLRSGKPLNWTSLGGEPLSVILNQSIAPWLELPCEDIQPIGWGHPHHFFVVRSDAEHERAFNERAICYMLSNTAVQEYRAAHPSHNLLAAGSFFRYLWQHSLKQARRC